MKLKPYTILKDKHPGETCFILGAGTSAYGYYMHPKREEVFKHVCIAVNSAILLCNWSLPHPNPDFIEETPYRGSEARYWLSNDALCRRWSWWDYVKRCKATKIVRNSWKEYYHEIPDFLEFWPRPTSEGIINEEDTGLAYCSSVPSSLDLAIQMACKKIFILGLDHYMIGDDKSHFWQYFSKQDQPTRIDRTMATHSQMKETFVYNDLAFAALRKFADSKSVEIYNCNPKSKVDVFEKIDLNTALKGI